MPAWAIPLALSGLSALGGALGGRGAKQEQKTTSNRHEDFGADAWSSPTYDSYGEEMRQKLIQQYMSSLDQDPNLEGYRTQGQQNINQMSDVRNIALRNSLAGRGLSYSPIAGIAQSQNDNARIGEHSSFLNTLPLLQRKLQDERLGAAGSFFKGLPVGSHNVSSGTSNSGQQSFSTGTIPSNMAGSGTSSMATMLAALFGNNAFGQKKPSMGNV